MFTQTWKKYLPVIAILLKRSATTSQETLDMNYTDFERATGGRKIKFSFSQLQLNKGRINSEIKQNPLAKEFADLLREDETTRKLIAGQYLEFSLNNDLKLTIKNNTPAMAEAAAEPEDADNESKN